MKIHRFYIENIDISDENIYVTYETSLIHQLKNVFRYKKGQILIFFNEKIGEIEFEIYSINKKDMSFKYIRHLKKIDSDKGHKKKITLYMSVIKNSNFDLVVEKAVELGVHMIVPVLSERVIKNILNYERVNKISKEASEQSGRIDLMKIENVCKLENAVFNAKKESNIVFYGSVSGIENKSDVFYKTFNSHKNISIFIGPEGGFSDIEISIFEKEGIIPLNFNKNILRAETAAIVACGFLCKE